MVKGSAVFENYGSRIILPRASGPCPATGRDDVAGRFRSLVASCRARLREIAVDLEAGSSEIQHAELFREYQSGFDRVTVTKPAGEMDRTFEQ
jgi:hypothetical protein